MRKERDIAVRAWVREYTKNSAFKVTQKDRVHMKHILEAHALEDILEDIKIMEAIT